MSRGSHWVFVLAATNLLAPEFCGTGDVFAIIFAIGHWGWNAWRINGKQQLAFVAVFMLCAGVASMSLLHMVLLILRETNTCQFFFSIWYLSRVCADAYSYALMDIAGILHQGNLLLFLQSRALWSGSCTWKEEEGQQWIILWCIQTLQGKQTKPLHQQDI